ncbi:hypothetical protein AAY473_024660 [Plecturocebus cupreus]
MLEQRYKKNGRDIKLSKRDWKKSFSTDPKFIGRAIQLGPRLPSHFGLPGNLPLPPSSSRSPPLPLRV